MLPSFFRDYKSIGAVACLSLFMAACMIPTEITLHDDGSAQVKTSYVKLWAETDSQLIASQYSFFNSGEISGLRLVDDSLKVAFDIRTIDSLGNYLYTGFYRDYFRFNYRGDTLTFTESEGVALKNKHFYDCCTFAITITSQSKIKSIHSNYSLVKQRGNTFTIIKKGRHFRKGTKKLDVMIVYE